MYVCMSCHERRAYTLSDGCLTSVKKCAACGRTTTQRKRRPADATDPKKCTWKIPCADHRPNRRST